MLLKLFGPAVLVLAISGNIVAQKKPLDHSVYDGWESINAKDISRNGKYVSFEVVPQEGDGKLVLMAADNSWTLEVPRATFARISPDSRYAVFKIKPPYEDTREARIKKKKPDDMPKDSLGFVMLGQNNVSKIARVKSFQMPEEGGNWFVYQKEKPLPDTSKKKAPKAAKNPQLDSAKHVIDSLQYLLNGLPEKVKKKYLEGDDADDFFLAEEAPAREASGTELVWHNLETGIERIYENTGEYLLAKKGTLFAIKGSKPAKDTLALAALTLVDPTSGKVDTILRSFNDMRSLSFDEAGTQLAFVAERDSSEKAKKKFFKLWYWKTGADSAEMIADKSNSAFQPGMIISDKGNISFSKSGQRLFFGIAKNWPDKDTSLPEFDRVSVDIWHYNDDYVQPVQLKNLSKELDRTYLVAYLPNSKKLLQLGDSVFQDVRQTGDGDGKWFYTVDDRKSRISSQWAGRGMSDLYLVNPETGERKLIKSGLDGNISAAPGGQGFVWYDTKDRQYHSLQNGKEVVLTSAIKVPLYDEENDVPDEPNPHGVMAWEKDGTAVYIYDKYDIWKIDPTAAKAPECITKGQGRMNQVSIRYQDLNKEEKFVETGKPYLFTLFDNKTKKAGLKYLPLGSEFALGAPKDVTYPARLSNFVKAKDADVLIYSTENYERSADVRVGSISNVVHNPMSVASVYQPNPQQASYYWGTAELVEWKAYDGKMTQGIVYKPENFDPKKKYPMIAYFYETLSDGLYGYQAPAPTPSRLNIPFFVSRGYVVFAPDIHYKIGYPGQSAYDYIVSGARYLVKQGYVDSTKMGLQGQSWGGYQTVYLITQTKLFAAAWAGAPVANMTSAYGGIRWGTGLNRQFQYEKTQSRIGGNIWDKKDLYLKNSPLFYIPKVTTPLVIMHNDEDGAVPWYQGIEMYTAMRRAGKQVWMLNYNGEDHNLVQRKNRKDISIREQQYFDWLLKGEKAPKWLTEGVPATMKGRDLGLTID